jgi:alkylhydroperoxidase family enzyme
MMVDAHDGGTASLSTDGWSLGGATALQQYAPAAAAAFLHLQGVRPAGLYDEVLDSPAVAEFAEQFRVDVAGIDEQLRAGFAEATGGRQFEVAQMVWVADVAARLSATLDALFGSSTWPVVQRRVPIANVWATVESFTAAVAHLGALDPTATELIRLRGARQHQCRICMSRRSVAAIEQGADEATFTAVDHYEDSDFPASTKAALALVDAIIWTPTAIPDQVVARVHEHLTEAEAVEVVLDTIRNAANKIAVALGTDAPEVSDGVQLFVTDADGVLSTV